MTAAPGEPEPSGQPPAEPSPPPAAQAVPSQSASSSLPPESSPTNAERPGASSAPRKRKPDPWAHRRGEPRVFAFFWTLFLFIATGLTFMAAVSLGGTSADVMRPATRALLAVTIAGIVLLWPMVRLSQLADAHPISGVLQDLVVVLIPAQAIIWPQWLGWLGRWPLDVVAAVAALFAAWGFLTGGLLALAQVCHHRAQAGYGMWSPWRWMLGFAGLAVVGAAFALATGAAPLTGGDLHQPAFRGTWMLSPMTAAYELTTDRSWTGASARVVPAHWWSIALTAAAALPLWGLAAARARGSRPRGRLHYSTVGQRRL